ncbi:hypothetical protein [Tomitella gaofuii]|uniref:hypothetical protein n=1 Tax=Tomitella gaofuii TaxID=2760083 RepID=UPI0015FBCA73|nr:hypothetical protein [Tomitella gaofuii]
MTRNRWIASVAAAAVLTGGIGLGTAGTAVAAPAGPPAAEAPPTWILMPSTGDPNLDALLGEYGVATDPGADPVAAGATWGCVVGSAATLVTTFGLASLEGCAIGAGVGAASAS